MRFPSRQSPVYLYPDRNIAWFKRRSLDRNCYATEKLSGQHLLHDAVAVDEEVDHRRRHMNADQCNSAIPWPDVRMAGSPRLLRSAEACDID